MSQRVFITGATSGIGRQLAADYHAAGWQVWGAGRDAERLGALAALGVTPVAVDVTSPAALSAALAPLPTFDLVILNAGTCEYIDTAHGFDGALLARIMHSNVNSVGFCLQALLDPAAPKVLAGARIAIVSSSVAWLALPTAEAYGASKAALNYLATSLRLDLAKRHIAVSLIRPGFVATPLTAKNTFPMPALITVQEAATHIRHGLDRGANTIHFPRRFIWLLRLLGALPTWAWLKLSLALRQKVDLSSTQSSGSTPQGGPHDG
ncbi:MAG: SDR family NAD(P)-dependent oxidoreductase [Aeromonas sp.]